LILLAGVMSLTLPALASPESGDAAAEEATAVCPEVTLPDSHLKANVCPGEMRTWRNAELGELVRRDAQRGFTRPLSYPGLDLNHGLQNAGASVRQ
jgi:hypothetical protein